MALREYGEEKLCMVEDNVERQEGVPTTRARLEEAETAGSNPEELQNNNPYEDLDDYNLDDVFISEEEELELAWDFTRQMRELNTEVKDEINNIANQVSLMEARLLRAMEQQRESFYEETRKVKKEMRWISRLLEDLKTQVMDSETEVNGRLYQAQDSIEEVIVASMDAFSQKRGFYTDVVLDHMNRMNMELKKRKEEVARFGPKVNEDADEDGAAARQ